MPSEKTIWKFMSRAKRVSKLATYKKQHIGSVLVYGNKIIATGYNTNKTNPLQFYYNRYRGFNNIYTRNNGTLHAESMILLKTKFLDVDWSKCTLYTYRELKDGSIASAKPCPACQVALMERGVGTVIFSTGNPPNYQIWKGE